MKKTRKKIIIFSLLLLIAAAAGSWAWFYFRDREERLLRAMVAELEEMSAKKSGRSNALALLDAATPERVFAPEVHITSNQPAMDRRMKAKEIGQFMVMMKKSCMTAKLELSIETITVNGTSATVCGNALFSGTDSRGHTFREVRTVELTCTKNDGKWKISGLKALAIIEK